jgi:hypothetical protein
MDMIIASLNRAIELPKATSLDVDLSTGQKIGGSDVRPAVQWR